MMLYNLAVLRQSNPQKSYWLNFCQFNNALLKDTIINILAIFEKKLMTKYKYLRFLRTFFLHAWNEFKKPVFDRLNLKF